MSLVLLVSQSMIFIKGGNPQDTQTPFWLTLFKSYDLSKITLEEVAKIFTILF